LGGFKGNEAAWMEKYFDTFLYLEVRIADACHSD
jgi:hypothetical protein